jgi:hypothetical protein
MRSSYDGQRNDLNGAYHLIEDGFKFIRQYQNEPTMISWIFNVSNASISCKALCSLIKLKGVSDSQAKRFFELIDSLDFLSSINPALQGDFALCARPCFENFFREGNSSDNLKSLFGTIEDHNSFLNDIWPFYYQGYAFYLDYTLSQKLNIKKSDLWRMSLSWVCGNTTRTKELRRAAFYMRMPEEIVRIRMAELTRKAARVYSELDAARISLALHIYKNNNGAFPDSLEKLAPAILPEIPADPMTGKPFGYQRKGDYFELDCMHFKEKPVR